LISGARDAYQRDASRRQFNVARDRLADRVPPDRMAGFLEDFTADRFDEPRGVLTMTPGEISCTRRSRAVRIPPETPRPVHPERSALYDSGNCPLGRSRSRW
jgi:hypothetical protein